MTTESRALGSMVTMTRSEELRPEALDETVKENVQFVKAVTLGAMNEADAVAALARFNVGPLDCFQLYDRSPDG